MAKGTPVNKIVNGEIADADVVNQIIEDVGSQGGSVPYDPATNEQSVNGSQSLGSTALPWGSIFVNRNANFVEVDPNTNTAASMIAMNLLRKFISMKDAPGNGAGTYVGSGGKFVQVNNAENGLEFSTPSTIVEFISSGTFVCPAGITTIYLSLSGGGGQGANGSNAAGGSGGGGGGAGESYIDVPYTVIPGNSYSVTIGSAGGNTTFDSLTVIGGNNGSGSTAGADAGGLGRAAVNGTIGSGGAPGGKGGDSPFGKGGTANGGNAIGYGAGGGGGRATNGAGGTGMQGICIIKF